jgi:hypothetical protein
VATEPVHAPLAEHWLAPVDDHVSTEFWPAAMVVGASEIVVTGGAGGGADEPPPQPATIPRDSSASAHPTIRTHHPWRLVRIEVPFLFRICAAFVIIRWRAHAAKRDQHATLTIPEQARSRFVHKRPRVATYYVWPG